MLDFDELKDSLEEISGLKGKRDDDFFDRLNNRYTVFIILVMAFITTFYQIGGSPIYCWAPAHFADSHMAYANSYCWVRNTYYLPYDEEIPAEGEPRQTIMYYQWVPFILLIQAFLYYCPSIVWHGMNQKGGMDADSILNSSAKLIHHQHQEQRQAIIDSIALQLDRFLKSRVIHGVGSGVRYNIKKVIFGLCHMCGRRFGSYLVMLFLLTKLLYIANAIGQFFLLNKFLFNQFNVYGFYLLGNVQADHNWEDSPLDAFPRVTMCDLDIRRLGNVHRYTLQCALPLNLWNEKIYMFLWFWMVMVATLNIIGFINWLLCFIVPGDRLKFVQNHLKTFHRLQTQRDEELSRKFTTEYLKQDGTFLLRLIAHNINTISTTEITCKLWDIWKERPKQKQLVATDAYLDSDDDDDDDKGSGTGSSGVDTIDEKYDVKQEHGINDNTVYKRVPVA